MAESTVAGVIPNYPGVHVSERPPSVRTIRGAGTSTAVFVGTPIENADEAEPVLLRNFTQYIEKFGELSDTDQNVLAWSVYLFFLNGGTRCYVLAHENGAMNLNRLDALDDISLLVCPEVKANDNLAPLTYVQSRPHNDLFYVAGLTQDADQTAADTGTLETRSDYMAIYHPWIQIQNPDPNAADEDKEFALPCVGAVAGIYSRTDADRGVFKAPAGIDASLRGVLRLDKIYSDSDNEEFNNKNINLLRRFDGIGNIVWGARTYSQDGSPWLYVPVRRLAIFLRMSLYYGSRFAVFEPNDEDLWAAIRTSIGSFMNVQFRRGAFQGTSSKQAFFVKVDDETTTQADIDQGIVNIVVGFAPLKPAEFVVIVLEQIAGGDVG